MKIAMIGHKDFPCRSGGVEVVVYELATRLAARGEDVTVYNRGRQRGHNRYRVEGVNVIRSFTFRRQSLNAMVYSFTATLGALRRRPISALSARNTVWRRTDLFCMSAGSRPKRELTS